MYYLSLLFIIRFMVLHGVLSQSLVTFKNKLPMLQRVLKVLGWRNINIFYTSDGNDAFNIDEMSKYLDEDKITRKTYQIQTLYYESDADNFLKKIHESDFPEIPCMFISGNSILNETRRFLKKVNDYDFNSNKTTDFRSKSKWILLIHVDVVQDMEKILSDLCHVLIIVQFNNECVGLKTLLKTPNGSRFTSIRLMDDYFPNVKYGLNGRELQLGIAPYIFLRRQSGNSSLPYTGWMMDLLFQLSHSLNFTYTFTEALDGNYKTLVNMTRRRELDILYGEYMLNEERSSNLHFILPPLIYDSLVVLYKKKEINNTNDWLRILKPFKYNVYYIILIAYIIISISYILLEYIDFTVSGRKCKIIQLFKEIPVGLFGCLFQEGGHLQPKSHTGRILLASWWLFCVLIASSYSAHLISSLVHTPTVEPFNNIQELANTHDWKYGFPGDTAILDVFQGSTDESIKKLWNNILRFNQTSYVLDSNITRQFKRINTEKYAMFFLDGTRFIQSRDDCFAKLRMGITVQGSYIMPLKSPLIYDFEREMAKYSNSGLLSRYHKRDLIRYNCDLVLNTADEKTEAHTIHLENFLGAFIILTTGLTVSIIILIIESVLVTKYKN